MATTSSSGLLVSATQTGGIHFTIQQAKYFAATEAQQDGCTGNYRMFDSPFGNFLVPVVPTRAELARTHLEHVCYLELEHLQVQARDTSIPTDGMRITENVKGNLHVTMKMKAQHQI